MALKKLLLTPERNSYSYDVPTNVISVQLAGGGPRMRVDQLGMTTRINLSFNLQTSEYDYLRAFYRLTIAEGGLPFYMDLILDTHDVKQYKCAFVPGTLKLASQSGLAYFVNATVEVWPLPDDNLQLTLDQLAAYNEWGPDWQAKLFSFDDDFNYRINTSIPSYDHL